MQYLFGSEIPVLSMRFRDYIRSKHQVELELREFEDEDSLITELYLPESHQQQALIIEQEVQLFLQDPHHPRYEQASWQSGDLQQNSLYIGDPKNLLHWLSPSKQEKFTLFITALCTITYIMQLVGFEPEIMQHFHYPAEVEQYKEIWRYFSHGLVHLSPLHFIFNLTWWWMFAGPVESQLGRKYLILLFIFSTSISGIAQNFVSGPAFFGLSGCVYALLGFVFVLDKTGYSSFKLPAGFFTMLMVGIGFGFVSPFVGIQIGNTAHISGLIFGLCFALVKIKFSRL